MHAIRQLHALLLCCALAAPAAAAADPVSPADPVLAVLYVDNHSGDPSWDVLEKGLADMLVTDLSAQGLTVVERARLQALLDEQQLQKSAFFDPKTAVKVGKGLGATHVVIGALAAMKPEVRLDLHLIEVATGEIVVAAKVNGPGDKLFDLEQQLVQRFVAAFERTFAPTTPQTKVRDVAALLEYSKGLDLADKGQLEEAQKRIEQTIRLSPSFGLARKRKDEIALRIAASKDRRDAVIEAKRLELAMKTRVGLSQKTPQDASTRLAWRDIDCQLRALAVPPLMSDPKMGVAARGQDKSLRAAMIAVAECQRDYIAELDAIYASGPPTFWRPELPDADEKLAKELGFDDSADVDRVDVRIHHAEFLLIGALTAPRSEHMWIAPPLGNLDPTWDKRGWQALVEADTHAKAANNDYPAVRTLDLWAEALLFRNKTDEAIAKWQEILDRFPTSQQFERFERRIKQVLGLEHDHATSEHETWARGLASCDDMALRVGIDSVVYRRFRMLGLAALEATVAEVEKSCRGNKAAERYWDYLYAWIARYYGKHLRCAELEAYMAKCLAHGGSPGDIAGWRKNWTQCPEPKP